MPCVNRQRCIYWIRTSEFIKLSSDQSFYVKQLCFISAESAGLNLEPVALCLRLYEYNKSHTFAMNVGDSVLHK